MTRIVALAALLALPAFARSEVRDQGAVKGHLWTSTAGLENARTSLRALTALVNDATAWDPSHARDLVKEAQDGIDFARTHGRHLKMFANKDVAQDLARYDTDLDGAKVLLGKLQGPIAKGVGPDQHDTRADNTMLGGAASDRGLPPGKDRSDVTRDSGRGQRGGTPAVQNLRNDIKAAWDRLDEARKDLDKIAREYDTTTKLPEP